MSPRLPLAKTQQGFTLLELMVVIMIIGVIVGMASLSIGQSGGRQLEEEVQRVTRLLELAGEEAILKSQIISVLFKENGYGFLSHDGEKWQPLIEDTLFRDRQFSLPVELILIVDGEEVELDQEEPTPQVMIMPSGEFTPFKLITSLPSDPEMAKLVVEGNILGQLTVSTVVE